MQKIHERTLGLIQRNIRYILLRCSQVRWGDGRRVIAPRTGGIQIGGERRTKTGLNLLAAQFILPMLVENLHHAQADENGIDWLPRLWLVHQEPELRWKVVAMRVDVCIDAASIVLEETAVAFGEACGHAFGSGAHLQNSLQAVAIDQL